MLSTTLSSKGQVVIPKALRDAQGWQTGMSLVVEPSPQGLLLRPGKPAVFSPTTLDEVMGCAGYQGPALSDEDIAAALLSEGAKLRGKVA